MEFIKVEGKNLGDIKIFALSTCGWCKKVKAFFNDHRIAYAYIDVDLASPEETLDIVREQKKYNSSGSFPTIVIDGERVIIGFDQPKLAELVGE